MQVDRVVQLGEQYKGIPTNDYTLHSVGVDFGFSSSATAIVLTEFLKVDRKIRVLYAEEFEKSNPQDIVDICFNFLNLYHGRVVNMVLILKRGRCSPVNFATEHKQMMAHLHMLINKEYLTIPEQFDKLIISLRTAYANE